MRGRKETVVSRTVVRKAPAPAGNPISNWAGESGRTCLSSISGFFIGLLLFVVTFALPFCAAKTPKHSKGVAKLDVITTEQAATVTGPALVQGQLTAATTLKTPKGDSPAGILAYDYLVENYETWYEDREKTETDPATNETVTTTERVKVEDWRPDASLTKKEWAKIMLGGIEVNPSKLPSLSWEQTYFKLGWDTPATTGQPLTPEEALKANGQVAVRGVLTTTDVLQPPIGALPAGTLAYKYVFERFEKYYDEQERTEVNPYTGEEEVITEPVEVEDWVADTAKSQEKWAAIKLGGIAIDPTHIQGVQWEELPNTGFKSQSTRERLLIVRGAVPVLLTGTFSNGQLVTTGTPYTLVPDNTAPAVATTTGNDENATHRETIKVLKGNVPVLLAAELSGGQVAPNTKYYRIHTGSKEQLVSEMNTSEESQRWGFIIASVLLWTIALNLIVGPALVIFNIIPIKAIGAGIRGVVTFIALIIAILLTWITYSAVKYWWVIVLALLAVAVWMMLKANRSRAVAVELPEPEPEPDSGAQP